MSTTTFTYTQIPNEMKEVNRWVLWRKENNTKLPINARNGKMAMANNESTWNSFEFCLQMYKAQHIKSDGLGFMLGGDFFGVDIDYKEGKEIEFENIKNDILSRLFSYTETSISGKGIHIIAKGTLPKGTRRKGILEMYDSARFFALTGNVYDNRYILYTREKEIKEIYEDYFDISSPLSNSYTISSTKPEENNIKLSDDEVINRALKSKNKSKFSLLWNGEWEGVYPSHSEADFAFASLLAFWTSCDKGQMDRIFRSSGLMREKWDRKQIGTTYGNIILDKAISNCKETYLSSYSNLNPTYISYNENTGEVSSTKIYELNDTGNAQRFFDLYGDKVRYNFTNKQWLIYTGQYWQEDTSEQIRKLVNLMINKMQNELEHLPVEDKEYRILFSKNIKHLSNTSGKDAMLKELKHLLPIENKDLDTQDHLLNCNNGVVDLRNGIINPHDKGYYISKTTHLEVSFDTPSLWLETLDSIFEGNKDLIDYLQVALGYTLCGSIREQILFECIGNGSNGKSVLLNTIYEILGDYSINIQIESILTKTFSVSGNASPDIAKLNGARFVRTNEPSESARFNEGLVKQLTGGDYITARFLYGNEFDFKARFKLWIACNNKIIIRGNDNGIWRRIRLINFNKQFDENTADKTLEDKLRLEYPQILGWCVQGAIKYYAQGLKTPSIVVEAVNEYKKEMDLVEKFIEERCVKKENYKIKASDLYNEYKNWARNTNEWEMNATRFGREVAKKFEKFKVGGYVFYNGIDLLSKHAGYVIGGKPK